LLILECDFFVKFFKRYLRRIIHYRMDRSAVVVRETRQYVKKIISLFKGKSSYSFSDSAKQATAVPEQVRIYKVVLDDGTVLFTNSSYTKTGKTRF